MTDNEIIKALECCLHRGCNECIRQPDEYGTNERQCSRGLMKCALSLINRQKAEIERLQKYYDAMEDKIQLFRECDAQVKFFKGKIQAEAIKEFAERLKDMHKHNTTSVVSLVTVFDNINNLVKEMVGDDDAGERIPKPSSETGCHHTEQTN